MLGNMPLGVQGEDIHNTMMRIMTSCMLEQFFLRDLRVLHHYLLPQTHPLALYPQDPHDPNGHQDIIESTEDSEFPTLSLTEIHNARDIMDILSEMLNVVEPGKKESIKQGVIIDLVQQCRTYKQQVVHLINSAVEVSLLGRGLALYDDLQRLLAKHEAIASETSDTLEKLKSSQALIDMDDPEVKEVGSNQTDVRSGYGTNAVSNSPVDLLLPVDSKLDLLSSEEIVSSEAQQSLAIVPVGEPQTTMPASQQYFMDMFGNISPGDAAENSINSQHAHAGGDEYPYDQRSVTYLYGAVTTMGLPQHEDQQLPTYGIQENGAVTRFVVEQWMLAVPAANLHPPMPNLLFSFSLSPRDVAPTAQLLLAHIYDKPTTAVPLENVHLELENGERNTCGPKGWEGCHSVKFVFRTGTDS